MRRGKPQTAGHKDAVVFAGGRGERLRPTTDHINKNLLEVGGKPVISYVMDGLEKLELDSITLLLGYRARDIRHYIEGLPCSTKIILSDRVSCCPGHALVELLGHGLSDPFILVHGNIIFRHSILCELIESRLNHPDAACVAAVSEKHLVSTHPYSRSKDERVVEFEICRPKSSLGWKCWMGIYTFRTKVIRLFKGIDRCGVPEQAMIDDLSNLDVRTLEYKGPWFHLENREDLESGKMMDTVWAKG